jgi:pimeloyl-ACP methyl ester carboxylesterase
MGQSTMPDPALGDITMPRHGRDAVALLDHLAVDQAILVGWSMGVQVSLEAIRLAPSRVAGLVAISGTYGQPFRTGLPSIAGPLLEAFFALLGKNPRIAQGALDLAVTLPDLAFYLLSHAAFIEPGADRLVFDANVRSVAGVEKALYLRTMLALARHDASDVLPRLACKALVICAERDYFTPPRVAREMADRIPFAEFREVKGGSHFALIEQAALVNGWLREFVDRVFGARAAS